jgi:aspartate/methionine/tyrosine aminotransferase
MRTAIMDLEASKIREVANAGLGRNDVLAFWFGEGDEVTPDFVRQAAIDSLQQGETYYAHNLGLPPLRQAIADHMGQNHPGPHGQGVTVDRVAVTAGGVSALMLAVQALVNPGDDVLAITPVWPNLVAQPRIMGAHLRTLSLRAVNASWQLDLDAGTNNWPSCSVAVKPALGYWPMKCMKPCTTPPRKTPAPPVFWMWPSLMTAWSLRTVSPKAF